MNRWMGYETVLYGCIFGVASGPRAEASMEQNVRAIAALPAKDHYPELVRTMFCVTGATHGAPGLYRVQTIPFAGSFKSIARSEC